MPRSPPPSSACSTQHQSVSSKQVARHEPHSAACAESSSKKAKLSEGSPPPDTASSQAQSRKAFRDRMQALLEKVTTLCSLPSPQPHFPPPPPPPPPTSKRISRNSQVKPHVANCEGLQSTSALVHRIDDCMCAACLLASSRARVTAHCRLAHFGSVNASYKQHLLRLYSSLDIQNVRCSHRPVSKTLSSYCAPKLFI